MKNLKKLKAVLASELEARAAYKEAFDLVKDAESLEKYIKELEGNVSNASKELTAMVKRGEKAKEDTAKLEKDYAEQAEAMQAELASRAKDHQKRLEEAQAGSISILNENEKAVKEAQKTYTAMTKKANEAEARLKAAEDELAKIRGQLKSI